MSSFDDPTMSEIVLDTDGDGFAETAIIDVDGDTVADIVTATDPYSGASVAIVDTDADGAFDTTVIDVDGDGYADEVITDELVTDDAAITDDVITDDMVTDEMVTDDAATHDEFTVDDSSIADGDDGIHGDPMTETEYHQAQPGPYDCLPTSIAMVVSEFGGTEVDASVIIDQADEAGVLTPTGMLLVDAVGILEANGLDAEVTTGSMDDLRSALDDGANVIIGLDADDLYGSGDPYGGDDLISGHAVVITGIDDEAGLVYINDPGFTDGAGVAIPIEEFQDAWQDLDNEMVVVDDPQTELEHDAYLVPVSLQVPSDR